MQQVHDRGYKKLFSNRIIFRQLIETFVQQEWVKDLDFTDCETLDKIFIADHYKETESDIIYKVKFRGRDAYLVILLAFQSTVDRHGVAFPELSDQFLHGLRAVLAGGEHAAAGLSDCAV